jgi:NAD(P)-dependent dehydrogenase (short-subunit alcohol dehydrogenase family)
MHLKLQGSRALVTGGVGGIGWAIAEAFAAEGVAVAAADVRSPRGACGPIRFVAMDVADRAGVLAAFDAAEAALGGPVDILVNCAGLYPCDPLAEMTEAAWDRVMDTNAKGILLVSQECCRRLVAAGRGGAIVNITSGSAERARLGAAHYCASKAAAEMLTRCFALEFAAAGIRVNAVSPGYVEVETEVNPQSDAYKRAIIATAPLGRAGAPADVAGAVLFLCSTAAEWITGASYRVDGGSRAGALGLPLSRP